VVGIDAWSALSLAVKRDGTLWAWGHNDFNQLAVDHPDATDPQCQAGYCKVSPIQVCANNTAPCTRPFTEVAAAAAGRRWGLALKRDGSVWAWGDNSNGQLGDASNLAHTAPAPVCDPESDGCATHLAGVAAIAAGSAHAFALKVDGTLWTWGYNASDQLGSGTRDQGDRSLPLQVQGY